MGTAGPSLDISSEVPALPAACGRAMSSPPVFLGTQNTWGPLQAGAGILRKTMAPVEPTGLCVPHAAGARAHGSQAPATSWAQDWGLDTHVALFGPWGEVGKETLGRGNGKAESPRMSRLQVRQQRPGDGCSGFTLVPPGSHQP